MSTEHLDVLIVGAGMAGINAAYRLRQTKAHRSCAILEARQSIGGTWDLFRYPGVRSDSEMFTLGYPFRPWTGRESIADGQSILRYVKETASEFGIDRNIRFGHRVVAASWSSAKSVWTVEAIADGLPVVLTCSFLYLCTGYYSYDSGHVVDYPGQESFSGDIVHPQFWPEELDYAGKNVVVIGSGATAVTLVPALAEKAGQVTMLQRSPSYVVPVPSVDKAAVRLRALLPLQAANWVVRTKHILRTTFLYQLLRRSPRRAAAIIHKNVAEQLGDAVAINPHFTPRYAPWDQRPCLVPDGDLFAVLRSKRADIVTDEIATFTPAGLRLKSGTELRADVIVTATGLKLIALGGIRLTVDGLEVDPGATTLYKGMMLSGVPNLAWCVGYVGFSWTVRADLTARHVVRLLNWMGRKGYSQCVPVLPAGQAPGVHPFMDLTSGFVKRAEHLLPKQLGQRPWRMPKDYLTDVLYMRLSKIDDGVLRMTSHKEPLERQEVAA